MRLQNMCALWLSFIVLAKYVQASTLQAYKSFSITLLTQKLPLILSSAWLQSLTWAGSIPRLRMPLAELVYTQTDTFLGCGL